MNTKNNAVDLSYFRLSLLSYLKDSHPHLANDEKFISARVEATLDAYTQAIRNDSNHFQADYLANEVLYSGLHFSKHNTLKNILWNEFLNEVPEDETTETAIRLLPECEDIFAQYPLSDDFAYSPEYELLYTELTGAVNEFLSKQAINA